jgi:hypothetical protein
MLDIDQALTLGEERIVEVAAHAARLLAEIGLTLLPRESDEDPSDPAKVDMFFGVFHPDRDPLRYEIRVLARVPRDPDILDYLRAEGWDETLDWPDDLYDDVDLERETIVGRSEPMPLGDA